MENQGVLELWSLEHGKCIWTAPEDKECFSFDCELIGDGSTLNIAGVFSSLDQEDVYALPFYSFYWPLTDIQSQYLACFLV